MVTPMSSKKTTVMSRSCVGFHQAKKGGSFEPPFHGRGDWIRTSDSLTPSQVRYQAALRPDASSARFFSAGGCVCQLFLRGGLLGAHGGAGRGLFFGYCEEGVQFLFESLVEG